MTRSGLRPLAAAVATATRPVLDRHRKALAALMLHWPAIVGEAVAADSMPEKLSRGARGAAGVLSLRVSPGAAMEIQHRAPDIVERINGFLGVRTVDRLRLVQGPIPGRRRADLSAPPPLAATELRAVDRCVAGIESAELRSALAALGRSLAAAAKRGPR